MTVEEDQLDFVGKRHRRAGAARRLGAMVAPVASHRGAVVDDPSLLRYAEAVIGAFGQGDIDQDFLWRPRHDSNMRHTV